MHEFNDRFLSDREIRKIVGVSYQTLWYWRKQNKFPKSELLGNQAKGTKKSVFEEWFKNPEAWVEKHNHLIAQEYTGAIVNE